MQSACTVFFCLTLNTFSVQFLSVVENTYCNTLFLQLNPGKHCKMLETRRTFVASKKVLLLSWIFYFALFSSADAQQSRMRSGLFKKVTVYYLGYDKYLGRRTPWKLQILFFWQKQNIFSGGNLLLNLAVRNLSWNLYFYLHLNLFDIPKKFQVAIESSTWPSEADISSFSSTSIESLALCASLCLRRALRELLNCKTISCFSLS